jgi:hypothetical protein
MEGIDPPFKVAVTGFAPDPKLIVAESTAANTVPDVPTCNVLNVPTPL